jgi:hypothetical protein
MIHPPPNTPASGLPGHPWGKLNLVSWLSPVLGFSLAGSHPWNLPAPQTQATAASIREGPSLAFLDRSFPSAGDPEFARKFPN